jgi:AcrR family transcriptional regulator
VPRAKQRTSALRDRVLQVALDLLARAGVAGFTTREVARGAQTSTPAVYELFGDKAGLVRGVFFEGFRLLRRHLEPLEASRGRSTGDVAVSPGPAKPVHSPRRASGRAQARQDLIDLVATYRAFLGAHPVLAHVMFSRPFADFDPGPEERAAGSAVRELIVARVQRCIDAGAIAGDATDIAHVLVALTQGLAAAELAARLGTSRASIDRRWALGISAVLDGLAARGARANRRPAGAARPARGAGTGTGARAGSPRAGRARAR